MVNISDFESGNLGSIPSVTSYALVAQLVRALVL